MPHRNLLLLALGASFGAGLARPATHLAATLNQDYLNTYSTSSTAFLRHADSLLEVSNGSPSRPCSKSVT